ncbi:MAG: vitamin K epoxide reductase family protein [Saprospiraceae bacterium]
MSEQLYFILEQLIQRYQIYIPSAELKLQLQSHPSYPSLHALTGVLTHFGIENIALRVPTDEATLAQLPPYFVANVSYQKQMELVLVEKEATSLKIFYEKGKVLSVDVSDFLATWNGIVVAIEKNENLLESTTNRTLEISKKIALAFAVIFLSIIVYFQASAVAAIHFLLSLVGLGLSIIIIQHKFGLNAATTNRFCNLSETTSCEAVLHSKGAKLLGWIKMSDLSLLSFINYSLIWILFFISGITNYSLLWLASLFALPFVGYAIIYQAKVVKKWCPLCLAVATILILQAVLVATTQLTSAWSFPNILASVFILLSISGTTLSWLFLKPLLTKTFALEKIEIAYYKFKRNFEVFKTLHRKNELLSATTSIAGELVFGNQNAAVHLLLVTNPLCFYCKQAHRDIEQLLHQGKDKLKLTIRFNARPTEKERVDYQVITHLYHSYHTEGPAACLKKLSTVYAEEVDLEAWLAAQETLTNTNYEQIFEQQEEWGQTNGINFTPALYLNERAFPQAYQRSDLIYFVEDLIEEEEMNAAQTSSASIAS